MAKTNLRKGSMWNRIKRLTLGVFALFTIFIFAVFVLFIFNKDKISASLLTATNNLTQGEVSFDDISLHLFAQFPDISITLNNVTYFEKKVNERDSLDHPIAKIENIYGGIDILELMRGHISLTSILVENGTVNLIIYPDSSINAMNAVKTLNKDSLCFTEEIKKNNINEADTNQNLKFDVVLKNLELNNIVLNSNNQLNGNSNSIKIDHFTSSLELDKDSILASIDADFIINKISLASLKNIKNLPVSIQSSVNFNKKDKSLLLNKTSITILDALFNAQGRILTGEEKSIAMVFDGSDTDMHLFSLFLNPVGLKNLKSGDIYFKGEAKGSFKNRIPRIKCNFGIDNMMVTIPKTDSSIRNLNFKGSFDSGIQTNLSGAQLIIDTLSALLPNGYVRGDFKIKDFKNPQIDYSIDLKTNLDGFSSILNFKKFTNLKGDISIASKFKGAFSKQKSSINENKSNTSINFNAVTFNITDLMDFQNINGSISGDFNSLCINNLSALIGNTDIRIEGEVFNIINLMVENEFDVLANLQVSSKLVDLADLLAFIPSVGKGFPYQISDFESNISISTNRKRLLLAGSGPEFTIKTHKMDATINKMLPPVNLQHGTFIFGHRNGDLLLTFLDFDISFYGGDLKADVIYHSPSDSDSYVAIQTKLIDFNPGKLVFYQADSIPKSMDALLNGDVNCKLSLPADTNVMFSEILLSAENLQYQTDSSKYFADEIHLHTNYTNFNTHVIKNPLATLSTTLELDIYNLTSPLINVGDVSCSLSIESDSIVFLDYLTFNASEITYQKDSILYSAGNIGLNAHKANFNIQINKNPLATLSSQVEIEVDNINTNKLNIERLEYSIQANDGNYSITSLNSNVFGKEGHGRYYITPFKKPIELEFEIEVNQFDSKQLTTLFKAENFIEGKLNLSVNVEGSLESYKNIGQHINGNVTLSGHNLILTGINIDAFLKKVEKTQNFNLVDLGAVMVAGPIGLVVTKGTSATRLLFNDKDSKTNINQFNSGVVIKDGILTIGDMALSTDQNRIAANGLLNIKSKTLSLEFAVVDAKGCSKISQKLSGPLNDPKMSDLEVISSLFAPVTNLYNDVVKNDCEPFYTGSVKHPEIKK